MKNIILFLLIIAPLLYSQNEGIGQSRENLNKLDVNGNALFHNGRIGVGTHGYDPWDNQIIFHVGDTTWRNPYTLLSTVKQTTFLNNSIDPQSLRFNSYFSYRGNITYTWQPNALVRYDNRFYMPNQNTTLTRGAGLMQFLQVELVDTATLSNLYGWVNEIFVSRTSGKQGSITNYYGYYANGNTTFAYGNNSGGSTRAGRVTNWYQFYSAAPPGTTATNFFHFYGAATAPAWIGGNMNAMGYNYAADTDAGDAYKITLAGTHTLTAGLEVTFKAVHANTTDATLQVNSLTVKPLTKVTASGVNVALATGDIIAGQIVKAVYDGTQFQVISRLAQ